MYKKNKLGKFRVLSSLNTVYPYSDTMVSLNSGGRWPIPQWPMHLRTCIKSNVLYLRMIFHKKVLMSPEYDM